MKEQVSGGAQGAIVGASLGSFVPGVGTATGAFAGYCIGTAITCADQVNDTRRQMRGY